MRVFGAFFSENTWVIRWALSAVGFKRFYQAGYGFEFFFTRGNHDGFLLLQNGDFDLLCVGLARAGVEKLVDGLL